jgi:hypothetical protein
MNGQRKKDGNGSSGEAGDIISLLINDNSVFKWRQMRLNILFFTFTKMNSAILLFHYFHHLYLDSKKRQFIVIPRFSMAFYIVYPPFNNEKNGIFPTIFEATRVKFPNDFGKNKKVLYGRFRFGTMV